MYLFAQKVRSPKGRFGINAGLYVHARRSDDPVWREDERELVALVTSKDPGRRKWSRIEVAQGGNAVESYVDVIGPNDLGPEEIECALGVLGDRLRSAPPPVVARDGRVTAAFGCNLGAPDPREALQELAGALLPLFRHPPEAPWSTSEPLQVFVTHSQGEWHFQLRDADAQRVAAVGGSPVGVSIRDDVARDFRRQHGRMYPFVAEWVTGLDRDGLLALGGARFVDGQTLLYEWPDRGLDGPSSAGD